jgi:hypothetical protein
MRFPSFTRQDAWVYGSLLLTVLGGPAFLAIVTIQTRMEMRLLSDGLRSRVRVGQSMSQVLAAAEETLAVQGILTMRPNVKTYFMAIDCGEAFWSLWRDSGRDGRAAFRMHVFDASARSETGSSSSPATKRAPLTRDEAFIFADANASGCTVSVDADRLRFTIGNDGKVAAIEPQRPTDLRDWTRWLPLPE